MCKYIRVHVYTVYIYVHVDICKYEYDTDRAREEAEERDLFLKAVESGIRQQGGGLDQVEMDRLRDRVHVITFNPVLFVSVQVCHVVHVQLYISGVDKSTSPFMHAAVPPSRV